MQSRAHGEETMGWGSGFGLIRWKIVAVVFVYMVAAHCIPCVWSGEGGDTREYLEIERKGGREVPYRPTCTRYLQEYRPWDWRQVKGEWVLLLVRVWIRMWIFCVLVVFLVLPVHGHYRRYLGVSYTPMFPPTCEYSALGLGKNWKSHSLDFDLNWRSDEIGSGSLSTRNGRYVTSSICEFLII